MIDPSEITRVTPIGYIDADEVKMVSTKGGFYLAIRSGLSGITALAAGSHPAIVEHLVEKSNPQFASMMKKSERYINTQLIDYSKALGELKDKGVSIIAAKGHGELNLSVNVKGVEMGLFKCEESLDSLTVKEFNLEPILKMYKKEIVKAVSRSLLNFCKKNSLKKLDVSKIGE